MLLQLHHVTETDNRTTNIERCCLFIRMPQDIPLQVKVLTGVGNLNSPETSPALRWPVPEPGPRECDTSRCTDVPETSSQKGDRSSPRCIWTCDPAAENNSVSGWHTGKSGSMLGRESSLHLHLPDVVPLQTLDHLFHHLLHACLVSLRHPWRLLCSFLKKNSHNKLLIQIETECPTVAKSFFTIS